MIIKRKVFSSEVIIKRPVIRLRDGKRINEETKAKEDYEETEDTEEEYNSDDYLEENND